MTYQLKQGEINYLDEAQAYYNRNGISADGFEWELREGRGRYNKIVATAKFGASRCPVAFIDKVTGSMFVAGSWSQPAKTRIV